MKLRPQSQSGGVTTFAFDTRLPGCYINLSQPYFSGNMTVYVVEHTITSSMAYKFMVRTDSPIPYETLTELLASEPHVSRTQRYCSRSAPQKSDWGMASLFHMTQTGIAVLAPGQCDSYSAGPRITARGPHHCAGTCVQWGCYAAVTQLQL